MLARECEWSRINSGVRVLSGVELDGGGGVSWYHMSLMRGAWWAAPGSQQEGVRLPTVECCFCFKRPLLPAGALSPGPLLPGDSIGLEL